MKWFDVNDRLPKSGKKVLLRIAGSKESKYGEYSEDGFWYSLKLQLPFEYSIEDLVTHWATIPKHK